MDDTDVDRLLHDIDSQSTDDTILSRNVDDGNESAVTDGMHASCYH